MASVPGIVNRALQHIKASKRISALSEGTKEANAADEIYEEARDELLEMHTWNFATKRVKLARLSSTPAFEWDHEYQLPSDFIRVHSVHNNANGTGRIEYKLEDGKILTDADDVYLRYVYRVTDPNRMTPLFRAAFSRYLAISLAMSLGNSSTLAERQEERFNKIDLPRAKSTDALQDTADEMPESSWVSARYGDTPDFEPSET